MSTRTWPTFSYAAGLLVIYALAGISAALIVFFIALAIKEPIGVVAFVAGAASCLLWVKGAKSLTEFATQICVGLQHNGRKTVGDGG